jgi:hypothetical protein
MDESDEWDAINNGPYNGDLRIFICHCYYTLRYLMNHGRDEPGSYRRGDVWKVGR